MVVDFFQENSFPDEPTSRTNDRVSRVKEENQYLGENYPQLHELMVILFSQLNEKFKPINIRGLRNLIGYPVFWLKKLSQEDEKLKDLVCLCLGHTFQKNTSPQLLDLKPDRTVFFPANEDKADSYKDSVFLPIENSNRASKLKPSVTALERVVDSMQHVYELLINTQNHLQGNPLVGSGRVLNPLTVNYNQQYQGAFSALVEHSYPDKLGIKPRDEKLWAWVRAGLEIMFPIPDQHDAHKNLYQSLYTCQTNLVILNAIADDIADNFRDQQYLDQILSVFPKKTSNGYFIQIEIQHAGRLEIIDLNTKKNVERYLREVVFKDRSAIEKKIRAEKSTDFESDFRENWKCNKENKGQVLAELLSKASALEKDFPPPTKELEDYISDQVRLHVEKEVNSKVQYILLAWEIFTESFKEFESLIQIIQGEVNLSSITEIIIDAYTEIFNNFRRSVELNCKTDEGSIIIASKVASHNMNIMAFHQMCAVLSLSLESKKPDDIAAFIDAQDIKTLFMTEQMLGRYSNILATGVPTQKSNSDGTTEIKLSREFKLGDITGMPELMEYLNDPVRSTSIRTRFNNILKALKSSCPEPRHVTIGDFSSLLIEIDAQKVITDKFVEQFKNYQKYLQENPKKETDEFQIIFNSFTDTSAPNPQIVFLLFYLMFKGEI